MISILNSHKMTDHSSSKFSTSFQKVVKTVYSLLSEMSSVCPFMEMNLVLVSNGNDYGHPFCKMPNLKLVFNTMVL